MLNSKSRILAALLALVLLCTGLPLASASAAPEKPTGLQITTNGSQKVLYLQWNAQSAADGYQVFRSPSGKKGSYQKIATVRGQTAYTDSDLKGATTYYYAVRAFQKTADGTRCSAFAKLNASTRLTKKALQQKLVKANRFYIGWMLHCFEAWDYADYTDQQPIPGEESDWLCYIRIRSDKYRSVADLKKEAAKYFTKAFYETYIDGIYADIDGKLYIKSYDQGGEGGMDKGRMKILSLTDTACSFRVTETNEENDFVYRFVYKMIYQNGRWLFYTMTDSFSIYFQGNDFWNK